MDNIHKCVLDKKIEDNYYLIKRLSWKFIKLFLFSYIILVLIECVGLFIIGVLLAQ